MGRTFGSTIIDTLVIIDDAIEPHKFGARHLLQEKKSVTLSVLKAATTEGHFAEYHKDGLRLLLANSVNEAMIAQLKDPAHPNYLGEKCVLLLDQQITSDQRLDAIRDGLVIFDRLKGGDAPVPAQIISISSEENLAKRTQKTLPKMLNLAQFTRVLNTAPNALDAYQGAPRPKEPSLKQVLPQKSFKFGSGELMLPGMVPESVTIGAPMPSFSATGKPSSRRVISPSVKAPSPQARAISPSVKAPSPQAKVTSPSVKAPSPQAKVTSPSVKAPSPERVMSPSVKAPSPERIMSPSVKASSPERIMSPSVKTSSPERIMSPSFKASPPKFKVISPSIKGSTSVSIAPSPVMEAPTAAASQKPPLHRGKRTRRITMAESTPQEEGRRRFGLFSTRSSSVGSSRNKVHPMDQTVLVRPTFTGPAPK